MSPLSEAGPLLTTRLLIGDITVLSKCLCVQPAFVSGTVLVDNTIRKAKKVSGQNVLSPDGIRLLKNIVRNEVGEFKLPEPDKAAVARTREGCGKDPNCLKEKTTQCGVHILIHGVERGPVP